MGNLYRADLDIILRNQFREAARQKGTGALFFETLDETKNIYTDIEVTELKDPITVDIIFQEYPQNRRTLERHGWYNKDSADNPATAYVPLDLSILKRWQYVLLPGRITLTEQANYWRKYHVTRISSFMEHPGFYTIALAPVFDDKSPELDRSKNTNFIDFSDPDKQEEVTTNDISKDLNELDDDIYTFHEQF